MKDRKKIIIIENDDFLREILGNLLHKKGYYIISGFCIEKTLKEEEHTNIDLVILGTSCKKFLGKKTLHYIEKKIGKKPKFFIINDKDKILDFIDKEQQILTSSLSLEKIFSKIDSLLRDKKNIA